MRGAQPVNVFGQCDAYQSTPLSTIREQPAFLAPEAVKRRPTEPLQTRQGLRIGLTAEVLLQARGKDRFSGRRMGK